MKANFTLSKQVVLQKYKEVSKLADIVSYSSKTNPLVTPILEENTNCLFSVHMVNELKHIKDKSRILFLAQGWTANQIQDLIGQGIKRFALDNESDLNILKKYLDFHDDKIELLLRVKLKEHSLRTERYFVFGMPTKVVEQNIKQLKDHKNITKLGIHFHRKTQNMAEWNLKYELENMFSEETLKSINVLNIGGGLPSRYANTNVDVMQSIERKLKELKEWLNNNNTQLLIEPGRFIAAPAGKLITEITGIHDNNIIVNASVYNSDMDAVIVPVKLLIENELEKDQGTPYVVKGCTPCSVDLFRYRVYLKEPKVGDQLVFINAGAYNFSSDFCDLETLETEITN